MITSLPRAETAAPDMWFLRPRPDDTARRRLFCFPYAGGSTNIFRRWVARLPDDVELFGVRLPGRDVRIRERPIDDWPSLITACREALVRYLDRPYTLFGHSFGASLAFSLACDLQRHGLPRPERVIVSACRCPHRPSPLPRIHHLAKPAFLQRVAALNGIPSDVLNDTVFMNTLEPMLRADMHLAETWPATHADRVLAPIAALSGHDDRIAPPVAMREWARYTEASFQQHVLPGDHFFIHQHEAAVLQTIADLATG